jgi:mono/diheme cytochrome c family protein
MASTAGKTLAWLVLLIVLALLGLAGFAWSGIYDIGADTRHTRPVHAFLETLRERSIAVRADDLDVPDLADRARITQGSGNYDAMCIICHRAPGMAETELSRGLYPAPPDLAEHAVDPAKAFWVIKHGIKSTGMPAWGESMDDAYIWNMVAFLQVLPELDAAEYQALVASSGGHSHGGGESMGHPHEPNATDHHAPAGNASPMDAGHAHPPGTPADHHDTPAKPAGSYTHTHADGTVESHSLPEDTEPEAQPEPAPQPDSDDHSTHDHDH